MVDQTEDRQTQKLRALPFTSLSYDNCPTFISPGTEHFAHGNSGARQGTFNCSILVSGVGGSGDPRRKWEEMGEREREREKKREC